VKIFTTIFLLVSSLGFTHAANAEVAPEERSKEVEAVSSYTSNESTLTAEDIAEIRNNLVDMGINNTTVKKLIKKLENGGVIDADIMLPEQAVSSEEKVENGIKTITYTFPDGSRSRITSQVVPSQTAPSGNIGIQSISGGSCQSGSGYVVCTNRKVSYQLATYGYSFYADYQLVNQAYDKINWAGNWNIWSAGGTVSSQSMRIIRATESVSGKAEARLSAVINLANGAGSLTRSLSLLVGGDSATDKWNQYY
jgi:hypothetical protein